MMLWKTTGEFVFMVKINPEDEEYEEYKPFKLVTYTDLKDIPENFNYMAVIKFMPNVPRSPHTVQEHEQMMHISDLFQKYVRNGKTSL